MNLLNRLRKNAQPVARRRRVTALRSWVTFSPGRARTVILTTELILAAAFIAGAVRAVVWVQQRQYEAAVAQYEASVATPTGGAVITPNPLTGAPVAGTPTGAATQSPVALPTLPAPPSARAAPAAAQAGAERVTRAFVKAWLAGRKARTQQAWLDTLEPLTTSSLHTLFAATDRGMIPAATVRAVEVTADGDGKARATVVLDGNAASGSVTVGLVYPGGRWLVDDVAPVD